jgi:K+-transporting ATPase KdpF subunit
VTGFRPHRRLAIGFPTKTAAKNAAVFVNGFWGVSDLLDAFLTADAPFLIFYLHGPIYNIIRVFRPIGDDHDHSHPSGNPSFPIRGGRRIHRVDYSSAAGRLGFDRTVRPIDGGFAMNGLYLVAGAVALALLAYLVLALLKPEWFG